MILLDISQDKGMYLYFDHDNELHILFMYKRYQKEKLKKKLPISYDATKGDYLLYYIVNNRGFIGQDSISKVYSTLSNYSNKKINKHYLYHNIQNKFPLLTKNEFDKFKIYMKEF